MARRCPRAISEDMRAGHSYLVRMIKPNLIVSHDWHVQPICQRSVWATRLSGAPLDRGPGCYAGVSSNLLRTLVSVVFTAVTGVFARTF